MLKITDVQHRPVSKWRIRLSGLRDTSHLERLRVLATALSLLALGACNEPRYRGGRYMLPQARGLELGMTNGAVKKVRPGTIRDSNGIWEHPDAMHSNNYLFGEDARSAGDGSSGDLYGVVMDQDISVNDTVRYRSEIRAIVDTWTGQTGVAPSLQKREVRLTNGEQRLLVKRLFIWRAGEVKLVLVYDEDLSAVYGQTRLIRAVVQDSATPLKATIGMD